MIRLLTLLFLIVLPSQAADLWSVEYHRGLAGKQRGDLSILLHGNRVFSHAFTEPPVAHFRRRVPYAATVEVIVTITEAPGTVWSSNPMGQDVPETPARLCLVLQRDWTTEHGRWFSVPTIEIRPGTHRLIVPLQSWAWISVYGKSGDSSVYARDAWRRAWTRPARIGIGGGGHFKAHGIECPEGVGVFQVTELRVRS